MFRLNANVWYLSERNWQAAFMERVVELVRQGCEVTVRKSALSGESSLVVSVWVDKDVAPPSFDTPSATQEPPAVVAAQNWHPVFDETDFE